MGSRNPGRSVPLAQYFQHAGCGLLVTCLNRDCLLNRRFEIPEVVTRLAARGVAVHDLGIQEVARYIRSPCPRCGGLKFETRPDWPAGVGAGAKR
jgi:hypothetical protein